MPSFVTSQLPPLPIDSALPELIAAVRSARAAVLVAPPGAGKTTRVPPAILQAGLLDRQHPNLIMLQPRRVAARAAAVRIADEHHWQVGHEVGYQIRFERVMTDQTRLRVVTEGILTRQLVDDPFLEGIGAVILDEFHERGLQTDMAAALLREARQTVRPDLIIIVMSATLEAEPVARFLGDCPIVRSEGKVFPIEIEHRPPSAMDLEDRIAREVDGLDRAQSGDVLVFLPGAREIQRTLERVRSADDLVLPLHGSLPFEEQLRALRPANQRKIILATNIAETSLTIPGVRTVIDSGLARQAAYDNRRGLDELRLQRISRASAAQRSGRAGRTAPGRCIRLWTAKEHATLDEFDLPEVRRIDLAATILALHAWGKSDPRQFGWYEAPSEESVAGAENLLWMLGALTTKERGNITPLGRRMLGLPVHPRLARLLIAAAEEGLAAEGATLAALLSERDAADTPASNSMQGESDLLVRMSRMNSRDAVRLRDQLQRMVSGIRTNRRATPDDSELLKLALLAYPDRVARRRATDHDAAVMVGGGGLRMGRESVVRRAEYFIAVDARQDDRGKNREALVRVASAIEPQWLEECFPGSVQRTTTAQYDEARRRVVGVSRLCYLDLVLTEEPDARVDAKEAAAVLAAALRNQARQIFTSDESAGDLLGRVEFLRKWMPEHPWPIFDDVLLGECLIEACQGKRGADDLKNLSPVLLNHLPYPLDRLLDQHAPPTMTVNSGKHIRLRYEPGRSPVLSVKLQELFGWKQTPRVAAGRVAMLLELLGPNYRPVQVTDDLASFWKNTYPQVRKDLRRRYPKHSWPEEV